MWNSKFARYYTPSQRDAEHGIVRAPTGAWQNNPTIEQMLELSEEETSPEQS